MPLADRHAALTAACSLRHRLPRRALVNFLCRLVLGKDVGRLPSPSSTLTEVGKGVEAVFHLLRCVAIFLDRARKWRLVCALRRWKHGSGGMVNAVGEEVLSILVIWPCRGVFPC